MMNRFVKMMKYVLLPIMLIGVLCVPMVTHAFENPDAPRIEWYGLNYSTPSWSNWYRTANPVWIKSPITGKQTCVGSWMPEYVVIYYLEPILTGEDAATNEGGLSEALLEHMCDGYVDPDMYYMALDFGLYTQYTEYFKQMGWIDPAYQLPQGSYVFKDSKTAIYDKAGNKYPIYNTDCPTLAYYYVIKGQYIQAGENDPTYGSIFNVNDYVPKYILDAQAAKTAK